MAITLAGLIATAEARAKQTGMQSPLRQDTGAVILRPEKSTTRRLAEKALRAMGPRDSFEGRMVGDGYLGEISRRGDTKVDRAVARTARRATRLFHKCAQWEALGPYQMAFYYLMARPVSSEAAAIASAGVKMLSMPASKNVFVQDRVRMGQTIVSELSKHAKEPKDFVVARGALLVSHYPMSWAHVERVSKSALEVIASGQATSPEHGLELLTAQMRYNQLPAHETRLPALSTIVASPTPELRSFPELDPDDHLYHVVPAHIECFRGEVIEVPQQSVRVHCKQ